MLKKVGEVWWCDFRYKGKRIRQSFRTRDRLVALDRLQDLRDRLDNQGNGGRLNFDEFSKRYLEWAWVEKPPSALKEEQRLKKIKVYLKEHGIRYLDEIKPLHIEQLKAKLKADGLSKSTINFYLQIFRNVFKYAINFCDYKESNPTARIRQFKLTRRIPALTHAQLDKVMLEARRISEKPRSQLQRVFYDLALLAINTGLRRSEVLTLRWKDIKEEDVLVLGKGDKMRAVPLNRTALKTIQKQPRRSEYVFDLPNRYGPNQFARTVKRIKDNTGADFTFHLLRHAFTSTLIEQGIDIITVSEILGHSQMTTTFLYSHTTKERKRDAVSKLNGIKFGHVSGHGEGNKSPM